MEENDDRAKKTEHFSFYIVATVSSGTDALNGGVVQPARTGCRQGD
jgi:hypothetical protein